MLTKADPQDWQPVDIDLEPNAWTALRHEGSTLVVAGPGAGKTEFLAQRAAYLLQTGLCPAPYRLLAISFKVDAAENLARRVKSRCTDSESRRFVSRTFDAFTKSLVDRFAGALPEHWRPTHPYEVLLPRSEDMQEFLEKTREVAPSRWTGEVAALGRRDFESRTIGSQRLPMGPIVPNSGMEFASEHWWEERLRGERSTLTFTCLNRLAELAIRTNPQLRRALLLTYPFVFVDEFQDTTYAQYDFLLSVFGSTSTVLTAVGDEKQRIMAWAGAQDNIFSQFESDFTSRRVTLTMNHRSSPRLVGVQQVVARAIDTSVPEVESRVPGDISDDAVQVLRFQTPAEESSGIANWIRNDMVSRRKNPRNYALIIRQKADFVEKQLLPEFKRCGIQLRNESRAVGRTNLQDLLAENSTQVAVALLRLGAHSRFPEAWDQVSEVFLRLRNVDPDDDDRSRRAQDDLTEFVHKLQAELRGGPSQGVAENITGRIFEFLDTDAMRSVYSEYGSGDRLKIAIEAFRLHFSVIASSCKTWVECLELFEGNNAIPLMTVHKSKGLEYDTILFVGIDDKSWWSHTPGNAESLSTFFVGLSRAEQRVIFTYCEGQGRRKVADLYGLLKDAGVPEAFWP